jgi:CubicO group peptidase (beta-lactamase class C family)
MRDRKYGLGWWVYEIGGYDTCFAWGYGGQYVFVVPDLSLVIVTDLVARRQRRAPRSSTAGVRHPRSARRCADRPRIRLVETSDR